MLERQRTRGAHVRESDKLCVSAIEIREAKTTRSDLLGASRQPKLLTRPWGGNFR
jgi:hypothetical protein